MKTLTAREYVQSQNVKAQYSLKSGHGWYLTLLMDGLPYLKLFFEIFVYFTAMAH